MSSNAPQKALGRFDVQIPEPPFEATTEVPPSVCCPVCFNPFYKAKVFPCGHSLCGCCSSNLTKRECPLCRVPFTKLQDNYTVHDVVADIPVRCGYEGCVKVMPLREIDAHFEVCPHGVKTCQACGEPVPTLGVRRHRCHPVEVAIYDRAKARSLANRRAEEQRLAQQQQQQQSKEGPGWVEVVTGVALVGLGILGGILIGKRMDKSESTERNQPTNQAAGNSSSE